MSAPPPTASPDAGAAAQVTASADAGLDPGAVGIRLLATTARVTRWAGRQSSTTIPYAQLRVLSQLDDLGPSRISALATVDRCAQPTMSVLVQRLEDHRWVDRTADPDDTRASLISLNDAGRIALQEARVAAAAPVAARLRALGEEDVRRAADAVALLRRLLDEDNPRDDNPRKDT
jgi:DNA-binding MarR family transcriptional regulator